MLHHGRDRTSQNKVGKRDVFKPSDRTGAKLESGSMGGDDTVGHGEIGRDRLSFGFDADPIVGSVDPAVGH